MKEFKSKGISLENMVGADPMKEKKMARTPGKAYNQTIVLTEDLVWELRTFAADHRYRGVKDCHRSDDRLLSQGGRDIGPRQVGAVLERIRKEVKFYITFEVNNISK